jgi:hypothetical protein
MYKAAHPTDINTPLGVSFCHILGSMTRFGTAFV